ncbi:hypothetical protein COM96_27340 [Bacillus cereus]|uniref:Uncharacterized protein n=1 Tax=Bacillus cereus TaxID=1396 RepID=A0A2A7HQT6_BACCE|nr:hypothetical protein COM96_27340 [Bacillus cereus]
MFFCIYGTNLLLSLSIRCNPKKYKWTDHFENTRILKIEVCVEILSVSLAGGNFFIAERKKAVKTKLVNHVLHREFSQFRKEFGA